MQNIYSQKIWAKGCKYIMGPGDSCNKCGQVHNLTAAEAGMDPFNTEKPIEKAADGSSKSTSTVRPGETTDR